MGGGSTPQQQQTTQQLSPEQTQLLQLAMPKLQNFANSTPTMANNVVGFNPTQVAGQAGVASSTGNQGNIVGSAGNASQFLTSGNALDPTSNPALQSTINASTRPIINDLLEQTLPAIRSGADTTGNYGSSRQGVAEGIATGKAAQAVGDTSAKVATAGYNSGLDAMTKALGLAPSTAQAQAIPGATLSSVGDVQQQQAQAQQTAADTSSNYASWLPYIQGSSLASLVGGIPGGTTTTTATTPKPSLFNQILGAGALGASALGGGQGIAALLPFLSDRRYKSEIVQIGQLFDGTAVYRYKKGENYEIGVMAQEIEEFCPEAVQEIDGVKYVDLVKATERAAGSLKADLLNRSA